MPDAEPAVQPAVEAMSEAPAAPAGALGGQPPVSPSAPAWTA